MREHDALGAARRARGVDEAREVVPAREGGEFFVGHGFAAGEPHAGGVDARKRPVEFGRLGFVEEHHLLQIRKRRPGGRDRVPARAGRGDEEARVRILQDVGAGPGGVDGVQRHGDEAVGKRGRVEGDGVERIGEEHRDALALFKAHRLEGAAPGLYAGVVLTPGGRNPDVLAVVELAEGFPIGPRQTGVLEHFGNRAEVVHEGVVGRGHKRSPGKMVLNVDQYLTEFERQKRGCAKAICRAPRVLRTVRRSFFRALRTSLRFPWRRSP